MHEISFPILMHGNKLMEGLYALTDTELGMYNSQCRSAFGRKITIIVFIDTCYILAFYQMISTTRLHKRVKSKKYHLITIRRTKNKPVN
jgi:hypothetical protein